MRVGVDIGGTFTDFVSVGPRGLRVHKLPSDPRRPSRPVLSGFRSLRGTELALGTTLATNAVLERRGARVVFLTTEGFEDVLEIGRQDRPSLYDLRRVRPPPPVPRGRRVGVRERLGPSGRILRPLTSAEVRRIVREVRRRRADSVAICTLFSFANPVHEARLERALRDLPVSRSSRVLPEFREYDRASTTVLDAYVKPVVTAGLRAIESAVRGQVEVMRSSGGVVPASLVRDRPVESVLSGPAGGVAAAATVAHAVGIPDVVTFDMGGTSADVSLVEDGRTAWTTEGSIGGFPVALPMVDIASVGAGGGSIARVDAGGALVVGPESAGASPGPASYGLGGTRPTVTDAHLVLGHLGDALLGGAMPLNRARARRAVGRLRIPGSVEKKSEAILAVVEASMARPVHLALAQRGRSPADFALLAFGGAGPMHAAKLAQHLGMPRVLIPFHPGAFSAFGVLSADERIERSRTLVRPARGVTSLANRVLRELTTEVRRAASKAGLPLSRLRFERTVDVRYRGQSYEVNVPWGPRLEERFHRQHRARYGYATPREAVEVVTFRVAGRIVRRVRLPPAPRGRRPVASSRSVWTNGRWRDVPVLPRDTLPLGFRRKGPAIVEEDHATTIVPGGWRLRVIAHGILSMEATG